MSPSEPAVASEPQATPDADAARAKGVPLAPGADRNGSVPPVLSEAEFAHKNERRLVLIEKKYAQGLAPEEHAELEEVKAAVRAYIATRFPGPRELFKSIEERARKLGFVP